MTRKFLALNRAPKLTLWTPRFESRPFSNEVFCTAFAPIRKVTQQRSAINFMQPSIMAQNRQKSTAPYGLWPSPITPELLSASSISLHEVLVNVGLYSRSSYISFREAKKTSRNPLVPSIASNLVRGNKAGSLLWNTPVAMFARSCQPNIRLMQAFKSSAEAPSGSPLAARSYFQMILQRTSIGSTLVQETQHWL